MAHHGLLKVTEQFSQFAKTIRKLGNIQLANITLFSSVGGLWEGELLLNCLLTVALSSVLILIISRQLPCVCRVAPRGGSAACMVTAILEVSVGKVCAWLVRLSWRGVLRFPAKRTKSAGVVE